MHKAYGGKEEAACILPRSTRPLTTHSAQLPESSQVSQRGAGRGTGGIAMNDSEDTTCCIWGVGQGWDEVERVSPTEQLFFQYEKGL